MFRKHLLLAVLLLIAGMAAGCGQDEATGGGASSPAGMEAGETAAGGPAGEPSAEASDEAADEASDEASGETAADETPGGKGADALARKVFEGAYRAHSELDSYTQTITGKWETISGGISSQQDVDIRIDAVMKPKRIFRMSSRMDVGDQIFETDMIITEDHSYMYDAIKGVWTQYPVRMADGFAFRMNTDGFQPLVQLGEIEPVLDTFITEETGDGYRLVMEASDEAYKLLLRTQMAKFGADAELDAFFGDWDLVLEEFTYHRMAYSFLFDKATFHMKKIHMLTDYSMNVDGDEERVIMDMDVTFSNFNAVKDVREPEDFVVFSTPEGIGDFGSFEHFDPDAFDFDSFDLDAFDWDSFDFDSFDFGDFGEMDF